MCNKIEIPLWHQTAIILMIYVYEDAFTENFSLPGTCTDAHLLGNSTKHNSGQKFSIAYGIINIV